MEFLIGIAFLASLIMGGLGVMIASKKKQPPMTIALLVALTLFGAIGCGIGGFIAFFMARGMIDKSGGA
jgi:hypothetical protein